MTDALPLQLAIRLSLDNVSYSNPVPEWFEVTDLNYLHKEETLRATIRRYLGGDRPGRPFILTVPAKSGALKSWSVSSVDDQIILQACVSCTAEILESKSVDRDRVYSCRVSTNPNRVSLMEDQVAWWQRFQNDTRQPPRANNP